jgi:hypothetical protein
MSCEVNVIVVTCRNIIFRHHQMNLYAPIKLAINDSNYVILLRREPIRELLLVHDLAQNYNHCTNEMLIVREDFWVAVLQKRETGFH